MRLLNFIVGLLLKVAPLLISSKLIVKTAGLFGPKYPDPKPLAKILAEGFGPDTYARPDEVDFLIFLGFLDSNPALLLILPSYESCPLIPQSHAQSEG